MVFGKIDIATVEYFSFLAGKKGKKTKARIKKENKLRSAFKHTESFFEPQRHKTKLFYQMVKLLSSIHLHLLLLHGDDDNDLPHCYGVQQEGVARSTQLLLIPMKRTIVPSLRCGDNDEEAACSSVKVEALLLAAFEEYLSSRGFRSSLPEMAQQDRDDGGVSSSSQNAIQHWKRDRTTKLAPKHVSLTKMRTMGSAVEVAATTSDDHSGGENNNDDDPRPLHVNLYLPQGTAFPFKPDRRFLCRQSFQVEMEKEEAEAVQSNKEKKEEPSAAASESSLLQWWAVPATLQHPTMVRREQQTEEKEEVRNDERKGGPSLKAQSIPVAGWVTLRCWLKELGYKLGVEPKYGA